MKIYSILLLALSHILLVACNSGSGQAQEASTPVSLLAFEPENDKLSLPDNFGVVVVADSVGRRAAHVAVNDNGDIYVKMRQDGTNKGIVALRDNDGDGKADESQRFGNFTGMGIAIHKGHLYASSTDAVYRYALRKGELVPDTVPQTIVSEFPQQSEHDNKSIAFDGAGNLYVNVGAPSNACMASHRTAGSAGMDPCPQRDWQASIWRFKDEQLDQRQKDDGYQYCMGTRNCVALDWNPQSNSLFAAMHGRDQLSMFWPGLFDDKQNAELPSEEFFEIQDGDDFGWPFCYYDHLQGNLVLAPEYGGDGTEIGRCADMKDPVIGFPGHLAPQDLLFYRGEQFPAKYQNGAFLAFHGSWNRAPLPQKGFMVVFIPFENGSATGDWEIFAEGFAGLEEVASPSDATYRPIGLAEGPDGSLYVTDSRKGKVWRIVYKG